ncbi:MAG: ATP-binding protein [Candidatus Paceibacterota bacterium]|jgi:signal transduction histidine kinase
MDIRAIFLLLLSFINFSIGFFIYFSNPKNKINFWFGLSAFSVALWVFSNAICLFLVQDIKNAIFWAEISYVSAIFIAATFFYFSSSFPLSLSKLPEYQIKKKYKILAGILTLVSLVAVIFPNFTIKTIILNPWKIVTGPGLYVFAFCFLGLTISSVYQLIKKYRNSKGIEKIQMAYLFLGIVVLLIFGSFFNLILPLQKIYNFVWLGPIFTIFLVSFTALAITRYHLFQIKIILTEALVVSMAIILTILPFLMPSGSLKILTSIVLGLFLIFGFLLIKATHAEVRRKEEAERLLKAKTEFLSIASHQLRTPLTAIIGYSSMLKEGDYGRLPKGASEAIKHINDSSQRMIKLVNDFLSVSRLETGRTVLKKRDFSLNELIEQVVSGLKLKAKEKNLYLEYEKQKNDKIIKMDPEKMKEAISNLIDNSIHYTERGGITVSSKTTNSKIIITISDTGVGMSRQEISALFESFSRGKAGNELNTQGSGLGLYIAKKFVEMHNGRIWAESEGKDKGSFFHIEIPNK